MQICKKIFCIYTHTEIKKKKKQHSFSITAPDFLIHETYQLFLMKKTGEENPSIT